MIFCTDCVVSNQRPRIGFDENGVCNACNYTKKKNNSFDWFQREEELKELLTINAAINIFRCGDLLLPKYLLYWFKSPATQVLLDRLAPATAQRNLFQREWVGEIGIGMVLQYNHHFYPPPPP